MTSPLNPPGPPPSTEEGLLDKVSRRLMSCWASGARVPVEHFLLENPALAADSATVFELVLLESALREDLNDPPSLSELVTRFPTLAASLELQVAFRDGLRQSTAVQASSDGASPRVHFSIKGYEIGRVIGRGGMATVYEARQLSLNRRVALKMLAVGPLSDTQHLGRLQTEAEAVSRLQHPNVVQIHEVGTHDGQPFLALELVEGGTLADRLRNGPLTPSVAAELIETLARAVHSVHEHGIVHRDIKPANVLFTQPTDGTARETPKLSDFGLAKLTDGTSHPTRTGETLGTPAYMAPEQVVGSRDVGPTTDVYGLGAVFYECLTGQPPFRGGNVAEAMFRVSQHDPVPPSRLQPGVPRDLQTICLKCLEKSPNKRYQCAAELADDLGRFRRGEPVLARPLGSVGRAWKQVRRRPLVAALLLCLATTVVVGLTGVTWKWREADRRADGEANEREKAEINLYRSRVSQAALLWQSNNVAAAKELLAACVPAEGQPDRRGWEWNYLSRLLEPGVATLPQQAWVRELAVSPDGRELAVACGDPVHKEGEKGFGELVVINLDTHATIWRFGEEETVAVAYSPDGRFLASATADGTVRVFDRATRREHFVWQVGKEHIGLCFRPDGRYLAILSGLPADRLVVRDLESGEEAAGRQSGSLRGMYPRPIYSPDGQRVIAVQPSKALQLWNPVTKQEQDVGDGTNTQAAAFLGPSNLVTVGNAGAEIWDLTVPKSEPRRLFGHTGMVCAVAVHPTGTALATGGTDHTVRVWDARTARESLVLRGHTWTVRSVVFTPDGRHIISGGQDKAIKIWDATHDPRGQLLPPTSPAKAVWVNAVAFTPDGRVRRASSGSDHGDGKTKTWSVADGRLLGEAPLTGVTRELSWPRCYAEFSPDGARVVSIDDLAPHVLKSWDAETGRELTAYHGHTDRIRAVAVSPDGRRMASAAWEKRVERTVSEVRVWDADTGFERATIEVPYCRVIGLAISPDGRRLAVGGVGTAYGSSDATASIWDIETGKQIGEPTGHGGAVTGVTFSPDGRRIASVGMDGQLCLIDAATGRVVHRVATVRSPTCVAYHPSGRRLAVVGYEGVVSVRDGKDGMEVLQLSGLVGNWKGDVAFDARVRFSADGGWLVSTNWEGSLSLWNGREIVVTGR